MRMRAAGRTLTVGELREALAGLDDNAEVLAHDTPLMIAVTGTGTLELDPDVETDEDVLTEFRAFVERVANGAAGVTRLVDVREEAANLIEEYGA